MSASTFASVSVSLSVPVAVCAEAGILTVCAVYSGLYMPYAQYTVYMLNILYMLYMHGGSAVLGIRQNGGGAGAGLGP